MSAAARIPSAYELLSEPVRHWMWKRGWNTLRDIQERAIPVLIHPEQDVILCARTAGGKTEAAMLPLLSRVDSAGGVRDSEGFRIIMVSPLKALINDQFRRMDELCGELDIPVHRWHGDVSAHLKAAARKRPSGVLLITPESLEAILVRRGMEARRLFAATEAVVVDELHAFLNSDRGRQLISVLHRIERAADRRMDRVGLSATLADPGEAGRFLRPGEMPEIIISDEDGGEARLLIKTYESQVLAEGGDRADLEIAAHLMETLDGRKSLVFAGSRKEVEATTLRLAEIKAEQGLAPSFSPHHGSLAKAFREEAEERMRGEEPHGIVCTTTLELGLDVGDIEAVAQIGPGHSVSSMRQRLGRSGRRDGMPSILRVYAKTMADGPRMHPVDRLKPDLIRSIASMNLLIQRWNEPADTRRMALSVLLQQVMAIVAEKGGATARLIASLLRRGGAFPILEERPEILQTLLRGMGARGLLEQSEDGTLLLGEEGEKLVGSHEFFAVFPTPKEWNVVTQEGRSVGSIPMDNPCRPGDRIILGGSRWEAVEVDDERCVVIVCPARGGKTPDYTGSPAPVHRRLVQEMHAVLSTQDVPRFIDAASQHTLAQARQAWTGMSLDKLSILPHEADSVIFLRLGGRESNYLRLALGSQGLEAWSPHPIALQVAGISPTRLKRQLSLLMENGLPDPERLAEGSSEDMLRAKYDSYLPRNLLAHDWASEFLGTEGVAEEIQRLVEEE